MRSGLSRDEKLGFVEVGSDSNLSSNSAMLYEGLGLGWVRSRSRIRPRVRARVYLVLHLIPRAL